MPVIERKGSQSSQGFGEFAKTGAAVYIENVFSTWLYTGTGTNPLFIYTGVPNLAEKGAMFWAKSRSQAGDSTIYDTNRMSDAGGSLFSTNYLSSNTADGNTSGAGMNVYKNSTDGTVSFGAGLPNLSAVTEVLWTFRKQPKFFDIVTYTGNGSGLGQFINHSLGSAPGFIVVKRTSDTSNWVTWHRGVPGAVTGKLNLTDAFDNTGWVEGNAGSPSTRFLVAGTTSADPDHMNVLGQSYVAYLFAHNAGGFGAAGTDNVISCGSFTSDGSGNATVSLGYEPQWVMIKPTSQAGDWIMQDVMRNMGVSTSGSWLYANATNSELTSSSILRPTATGFVSAQGNLSTSTTYIYIAIRRGPMKTPTSGTSVFSPTNSTGVANTVYTTGFPVDLQMLAFTGGWFYNTALSDRLRGLPSNATTETAPRFSTTSTNAETAGGASNKQFTNTGYTISAGMAAAAAIWNFRRAPGFFDEVCYTGTIPLGGGTQTETHNLGVSPELLIFKSRSAIGSWEVVASALGLSNGMYLNSDAASGGTNWISAVTSTTFTSGASRTVVENGTTYTAYLFATLAGVSKVGTYTGTGALQTVNCGFTGGARFVLIKRTDTTGDWYVYDSASGISSGNDPYMLLNSTAAQVTGTNYVDTTSTGFQVTAAAPAGLNASGGTYLFLAIA